MKLLKYKYIILVNKKIVSCVGIDTHGEPLFCGLFE